MTGQHAAPEDRIATATEADDAATIAEAHEQVEQEIAAEDAASAAASE